jgi:hypothetical protein
MAKNFQVTLTGNEGKRLIAKAACRHSGVRQAADGHRLLLLGGTTVSAFAEELGLPPMRISGRIEASGTRTALEVSPAFHTILVRDGESIGSDDDIREIALTLEREDLIVVGANAIDSQGRAGLAFAAPGGGSRGYALHDAQLQGVPLLILCGLNKLIPDVEAAAAAAGRAMDVSMGAAAGLYPLRGSILTEITAFEILFGLNAVVIAGSGIGSGEGSRTFALKGNEDSIHSCLEMCVSLKGSVLSGDARSLIPCHQGCSSCERHRGCMYKNGMLRD